MRTMSLIGVMARTICGFKYLFPLGSTRFRPVLTGLAMSSSFVWNRNLLLPPFHKELIIGKNVSLNFGKKEINNNSESPRIFIQHVYAREEKLLVNRSDPKIKDKSRLYIEKK